MNAQEAILKIKALFEDNVAPVEVEAEVAPMVEETKVEMAEYSLMDGTKVEISALEIGGSVTLADGSVAPMGEHELMDGICTGSRLNYGAFKCSNRRPNSKAKRIF